MPFRKTKKVVPEFDLCPETHQLQHVQIHLLHVHFRVIDYMLFVAEVQNQPYSLFEVYVYTIHITLRFAVKFHPAHFPHD